MAHLLLIVIYLSFISLGLPDALLGSAWPEMHIDLNASISNAGIIFFIISCGTVVSSLFSDKIHYYLKTGKVTLISILITAISLFGFSISKNFLSLCLFSIPYGLGAGSIDAALNNYVALHYKSKHMSWLHCMWGVGATTGPFVMGYLLSKGSSWTSGYRVISILQFILFLIVLFSLPLFSSKRSEGTEERKEPIPLRKAIKLPGVKEVLVTFFCYCAIEQTTGLWASTYLVLNRGIDSKVAATFASLFFTGITIGRFINGFLTFKLSNEKLIRVGCTIIFLGVLFILLPLGSIISLLGFILIGLGCAPIYPCIIASTPKNFGPSNSQAVIGLQMASAYIGNIMMPPLFGFIAEKIDIKLFPLYILIILILMFTMYNRMLRRCKQS